VIGIEWNVSRQGILIPRIQIEPVEIGGASIQWLSGHNAGIIAEHKLGPGSVIIVRRSGDVIPTLDSVVKATEAQMPAVPWKWDDNKVHAVASSSSSASESVQGLLHAFQTLGVEGIGPGLVQKMFEGGFTSMRKVWDAKEAHLADCIGSGRAPALMKSLKEQRVAASISTLLVASNRLPRGVGERKLRVVFDKESDPTKWSMSLYPLEGWSEDTFKELLAKLPTVLEWIRESFPSSGSPLSASASASASASLPRSKATKFVVFSGFRDKVLEGKLAAAGWAMEDSVTKKTNVLVVPEDAKESGKVKKARDLGIQILTLAAFQKTLY
jgi:DNA ligase (NAD+)